MSCPKGCLRDPAHSGFHTTSPAIAEKEDKLIVDIGEMIYFLIASRVDNLKPRLKEKK